MNEYEKLLGLDNTPRQNELIMALIEYNSVKKAAKATKMSERGAFRMLKTIKQRQSAIGEGSHYIAMNNLRDTGLHVKGTSTLYKDGEPSIQWVKTERDVEDKLTAIREAIESIASEVKPAPKKPKPTEKTEKELLNLYITNDIHFGALMWADDTLDRDYDLNIAQEQLDHAIHYLVDNSPRADKAIIADLGDLLEIDDFKNQTPSSGHTLDVDGRYSKVMKVAMCAMVNLIETALTKHNTVHFINISGNHDVTTGHAIRAYVEAWYRNEPRVIVDTSPAPQKYFKHGSVLLGFAHGDGLRMHDAGEVMAMHNQMVWSDTENRFYHFGHNHKDKVVEGRLCKAESHRNIAPLNSWASHKGFGRQIGTMKCITYDTYHEKARTLWAVSMMNKGK